MQGATLLVVALTLTAVTADRGGIRGKRDTEDSGLVSALQYYLESGHAALDSSN